jgi:hypothetical protein
VKVISTKGDSSKEETLKKNRLGRREISERKCARMEKERGKYGI